MLNTARPPTAKPKSNNSNSTTKHRMAKLSIFLFTISATALFFYLSEIQSLRLRSPPSSWFSDLIRTDSSSSSAAVTTGDQEVQQADDEEHRLIVDSMTEKLRQSVTFLPLKDLRYSPVPLEGHTWFMSSLFDFQDEDGGVQYQEFPFAAEPGKGNSLGRLLCLKGRDTHDGSWNYYALAWKEALPVNATLMKGLTFVSYNHYDYGNIWHGLSSLVPFVAWHRAHRCGDSSFPDRWVLYHWGELRLGMGLWLQTLTEAIFGGGGPPRVEGFEGVGEDQPVCFEKVVVTRHNEGGMSRERRIETYDLMRCKARVHCNVSLGRRPTDDQGVSVIGMTLFLRTGARSFRNESAVIRVFREECGKVDGCRIQVAYSNNLTFCEQVKLMSSTDILVSPHGAQLTNMFLMDKNSSVMEFFPKGWLKVAGVGQFVYHWIASWSGMNHRGAWRDPDGNNCPFPEDDRRCMSVFKDGTIGVNETHFSQWAQSVLGEMKARKLEDAKMTANGNNFEHVPKTCHCG
ncbi:unnamed protein product [Linum tenue]|uniref:Glycosyltransferase 61 catalytic domain-containing protein n=2 Tax=Linum tenue TaxID=586396 RepID=A0AAV0GSP9_9ROSI|nr:unnamed protein product [Linum tenue]